jgi:predicted transcriptional regulator
MSQAGKVSRAAMEGDDQLREAMREAIGTLGISIKELSEASGLSMSAIYKLLSGKREPNLRSLRAIVKGIGEIEGLGDRDFVAIIASRRVIDLINISSIDVGGKTIRIREYPSESVEEAILAAVEAQRDGAKALICAPVIARTVEELVNIPTVAIEHSEEGVMRAITTACGKLASRR